MKKIFLYLSFFFTALGLHAQNRVGIGTTAPQAQLHTTGDVMFSGITNDNNLTKILVQNGNGLLAWRDAATLGNIYWSLAGNSGTGSNNFLGTTDNTPLLIKINNQQKVKINPTSATLGTMGGVVEINVDSLSGNGSGVALYRNANVNRWGTGIEFEMNNSIGQKTFYGRVNGGIESNVAGQENGILAFEVATNGQLGVFAQQVKMIINSKGYVGIGELFPVAQLHTNGTVLFSGITRNDTHNKLLVQNDSGYLFWRDVSSLPATGWTLTGNSVTTNNNFLGTTDNHSLLIRANNQLRMAVNTEAGNSSTIGGVVDVFVDSLKANGSGIALYRKANVNRWGTGIEFQMNNSLGQKTFYGRVNGGIESNIAGQENGILAFEVATNGQLGVFAQQVKMIINSKGYVGIGELFPVAQLHTNGTVLFSGITQNDTYNKVLVRNDSGYLFWRDAATIPNNAWSLAGNAANSNQFIGTINNTLLKLRTSNIDRVLVYSSNEISSSIDIPTVEILSPSSGNGLDGPGLKITRAGTNVGWAAAMDFAMNNTSGGKKTYARLNGGIESSVTNSENGFMSFEVAANGQIGNLHQQEKMRITSKGYVGIGTLTPVAQLHTTGSVFFEGLTNNDSYDKLLVKNDSGRLFWRNASSLASNSAWSLTGNSITAGQFFGSTNNGILRFKTSNEDRVLIYSGNEISTSFEVPTVEIISPSAGFGNDGPGLKVTRIANTVGWAAAMDFAMNNNIGNKKTYARLNGGIESSIAGGENGFLSFEVAANGQIGNLQQQEKMRITSKGYVGIGTSTPTTQLHTTGTVRFQNLPVGAGTPIVIDDQGNLFVQDPIGTPLQKSSTTNPEISSLRSEISKLREEIESLKEQVQKAKKN